jgi:hypothetical protein
LYAQLDSRKYTHVLQFDLSNFYDSIRLDILERWIREEAPSDKGWIIALLFYFLNQWNRRNTGLHPQAVGLPQDALADCSRILANFYLQRYDNIAARQCSERGALFFRYSDDQMILLRDPKYSEELLLILTRHLDRFGLRVNQKKIDLWTVSELETHRCRSIHALFAKSSDNKKATAVRRFAKAYLAIPLEELARRWNGGMPLLNRLIWADLESLPKRLFEKVTSRLLADEFLLRADRKKLEKLNALNKRRKKPVALTIRLEKLVKTKVHNAFHHEVGAFAVVTKNRRLAKVCDNRLAVLEKMMRNIVMQ